jgi:hypothetical protein
MIKRLISSRLLLDLNLPTCFIFASVPACQESVSSLDERHGHAIEIDWMPHYNPNLAMSAVRYYVIELFDYASNPMLVA